MLDYNESTNKIAKKMNMAHICSEHVRYEFQITYMIVWIVNLKSLQISDLYNVINIQFNVMLDYN